MTKMKTPKDKNPSNMNLTETTISRFIQQQEQLVKLLQSCRTMDLTRTKCAISLTGLIKLRLGDTLRFFTYHIERHVLQAERVCKEHFVTTANIAASLHQQMDMDAKKTLRTCLQGHQYYKSSDCPVCPICEGMRDDEGVYSGLAAPARRALENAGIRTISQLAGYSKSDLLKLHGLGPSSIPKLRELLISRNLDFRNSTGD